ncbi:hypothetical protein G6F22_020257 [Rhizopus arrhizus]|nr:hypothetical protein G6F22_020257 [Rhizopus arrhizus]
MRQHRRDGVERHIDLAAQQVGRQRAAALVRHMQQLHLAGVLELRADQVLAGAHAVGPVSQLARRGPRQGQQPLHVLGVHLGIDHQHIGHQRHRRDRREILLEVPSGAALAT